MPSVGGPIDRDPGAIRADFVLGDCFGASCAEELTDKAEEVLKDMGYQVLRNNPYSGGYTTVHYGRPAAKVHALQIEINRALYMDETKIEPTAKMAELTERMGTLIAEIKDFALTMTARAQGG
jgi:N-formylglutamate amidohydrolase